MPTSHSVTLEAALNRNIVFVHGKGGVGKTAVSHAVASCLASKKQTTLWITLEDPTQAPGELKQTSPYLWKLNCDFMLAFEEYAALKIGIPRLTQVFLQNKLMRYLAKAAPGVHDIVLLGKIWAERVRYSHLVVDMPSTGHGLALFQSTENFIKLFQVGPLHKDAVAMLETFRNPALTGHLIVALAEEMPLRESLELNHFLSNIFPQNPAVFLVNRVFPKSKTSPLDESSPPKDWPSPFAHSAEEYSEKRASLEHFNLRLWRDEEISFGELGFVPPRSENSSQFILDQLSVQLISKGYV